MPFTDSGEVDFIGFDRLLGHLIASGVHGLTLFGIASEFHKLTDVEKQELAERFVARTKASDVFSMISVTDHSLEVAVKRAKHYEKLGADCLMVLPPYFLNPPIRAVKEHILAVLAAVNIPVLIQYAPAETKVGIAVEELVAIYDQFPRAMFKIEANPPIDYISQLLARRPEATVLVGYAGLYMLEVLDIGGKGVMPGCSFAEIYLSIYHDYVAGKPEARQNHKRLLNYITRWMQDCEYIIQVEKTVLRKRGIIDGDYCRRPSYPLSNEDEESIMEFLRQFTLPCKYNK
ncbi:dihydrodipicolinate synthase family protein [Anaerosporomusa subterranea]|uniref:Dihydrodipicolinate synthase family protein n=2 Tax=Anaerosporomusa subterranea TaxID=1794912 RepID=A0A154BSI2_ANASB|nr:dihydrodipicolinate synthase family protein [Anaerosporomusa subterranea]